MRVSGALLVGAVALGVAVASCSGASHLGVLQFPAPPPPTFAASHGRPVGTAPTQVKLGIDLDFYAPPSMSNTQLLGTENAELAYIQRLHANAVAISFPYFMSSANSSGVYANSSTPTPAEIGTVARKAMSAGLYVSIRPLLSEYNLGISRVHWKPANLRRWFASYQRFLIPYVAMAQAIHVPEVVTGVEFSKFGRSPYWTRLDKALRRIYSGKLSYANNWGHRQIPKSIVNAQGVEQTVDAYRPLPLANNASQAQVNAAWIAYGRTLPSGIVISELGIAAHPGAYHAPYRVSYTRMAFRPKIQVRWFTAACHAVVADRLGGIYFWAMNFGQSLTTPPDSRHSSGFVDGPGARAISNCFQRVRERVG